MCCSQTCKAAYTVHSIKFDQIERTNEEYLLKFIDTRVGNELDSATVLRDVQNLRNLNLFFEVNFLCEHNADSTCDIVFKIKEANYIYPILSISGFSGQFKLQAGFNQINFLGRAQSFGALYQYYDRHSVSIFHNAPRHGNGKTGHELAAAKYSTVEPLYFMDTTAVFNFDNYSLSAGGFYWLNKYLRIGIGGMYMYELYRQQDFAEVGLPMQDFQFHKYQVRSLINYNKINYHFQYRDGASTTLYGETIQTQDYPDASFFKVTFDFTYLKRIRKHGNFGVHTQLGFATNNFSPFAPFVLDGFANIRGIGNRVARGTAIAVVNAEYQHTILNKRLFYLMGTALADLGTLRPAGGKTEEIWQSQNMNLFTGLGIRLQSRYLYNVVFRVDYSVNPFNAKQKGFTYGVGHFF